VVANWQVEPIGLDGLLDASNHHTDVVSVVIAGVKVCVVSDEHGQVHFDAFSFKHRSLFQRIAQAASNAENSLD